MQTAVVASQSVIGLSFAAQQCAARPLLLARAFQRRQRGEWQQRWRSTAASADQVSTSASPAAPQEQDEELALLQTVVAGTELDGAALTLAYDAQRDGWSADAFHAGVDGRGSALVVALTGGQGTCCPLGRPSGWASQLTLLTAQSRMLHCRMRAHVPPARHGAARNAALPASHPAAAAGGALIGGYNPLGWTSQGGDSASNDAFLFYVDDDSFEPVKLAKASSGLQRAALPARLAQRAQHGPRQGWQASGPPAFACIHGHHQRHRGALT